MSNFSPEIPDVLVHNGGSVFLFCHLPPEPRLGLTSMSSKMLDGSGLRWSWSNDPCPRPRALSITTR
jgi:hypothetical protein